MLGAGQVVSHHLEDGEGPGTLLGTEGDHILMAGLLATQT